MQETIRGNIYSDSGNAINNCNIIITQKSVSTTLYYTNTGAKNYFSIKLSVPGTDSLIITFKHPGYIPEERRYLPGVVPDNLEIILSPAPKILPEVTVAQKRWKSGDTTFFKVDSFKVGDERKLKDIISNLPGFNVTDDGILEYQRKKVEKILIDGEDIFEDKISLLLNNFPVHVINTVQALENQSNNKLLKGLTGENKVFVNLGIKKEKLKAAFGDGEAGIGTPGKYFLSPVIFALYGKLKMGFIGNYNNIGNGVGYMQEYELKNAAIRLADEWLMQGGFLNQIQNFENRHYINNQQWDNRLKLNFAHNKKIKSEIEVNYLKDRQIQHIRNRSVLFDEKGNIERLENINYKRSPDLLLAKEKTTWSIDEKKEITFSFSTYLNHSSGNQYSEYIQEMQKDTTENQLRNKNRAITAQVYFTNRVSKKTGYNVFMSYADISNDQFTSAFSASWPYIFRLTNADLTHQRLNLFDHSGIFESGVEFFTKLKKRIFSTKLTYQSVTSDINTRMFFVTEDKSLDTTLNRFSEHGHYKTNTLLGSTGRYFNLAKIPLSASLKYGFASTSIREEIQSTSVTTPVYEIMVQNKSKYNEHLDAILNIGYSNTNPSQKQLSEIILPTSFNSYSRGYLTHNSFKKLSLTYSLGIDFKNSTQFIYLIFYYTRKFSGYVPGNSFNDFVLLSADTFVRKPLNMYGLSVNYKLPSLFGAEVNLTGGFFYNDVFYKQEKRLLKGNILYQHWNLKFKRNWNKKYFITLEGDYSGYNNTFPDAFGKLTSSGGLSNWKFALNQKLFVSKRLNFLLNAESYKNNYAGNRKSSLFFAEAGCDFSIPKLPVMFTVKAGNLFNAKEFNTISVSPLSRSFNQIPLNKRSLFVSFRYEL